MNILNLEISRLHGDYDGVVTFNSDITILAGINGSFKSTILQLLSDLTAQRHPQVEVERAAVHYGEGLHAYYYARALTGSSSDDRVQQLTRFRGRDYLTKDRFADYVHCDYIKTFDVKGNAQEGDSPLDYRLDDLLRDYAFYLEDLNRQRDEILNRDGQITRVQVDEIEQDKRQFLELVNRHFAGTHKALDPRRSDFRFTTQRGRSISVRQLSSGEKQLLIMLLTVFLQRKQSYVTLMDEPETSLHLDWQYTLLDTLRSLNPNGQLILTTHAPSIFGDGWGDRVVYTEDVIREHHE